jgi:hypothetical protein
MGFGRGLLLWLIGIPLPIIILLAIFWPNLRAKKRGRRTRSAARAAAGRVTCLNLTRSPRHS